MVRHRYLVVILLLLASLIGALVTGRDFFYNLVYFWLSLILIAALWTWLGTHQLRLGRHTRALRAQVGRPLEERLVVRNTGRMPKLWLEVRDWSDLPGHEASMVVSSLGGKQERVWVVRSICQQRGRFRLGPLSITSGDPFGLFQMTRHTPQTTNVVIYPSTVELPDFTLPIGALPGGDALRRRTHYVTANASGVRDYAPGDSFNRIHWRSTARRDRLIVKEFELDPQADVWIMLDGDRAAHFAESFEAPAPIRTTDVLWNLKKTSVKVALPPSTEEYAISIAATLAQFFLRRDRAVGVVAHGQTRELIQPDRGERQLTKIMETLAVFRTLGSFPFHDVLTMQADQLPRGTTVILISPSGDTRWVIGAQALKRRGLRVVGVVINAASFGGTADSAETAALLWASGIPAYRVNCNDDLVTALTAGTHVANRFTL